MTRFKAIGFDYGGVIAGKTGVTFGKEIAAYLGVTFERYKEVYFANNKKVNVEGVTWPDFWKFFAEEIGLPEKYQGIMKISDAYAEALDVINPEMVALIDEIRQSGYKTGLLSNNSKQKGDKIRQAGLAQHFDAFHISAETGVMKPDPEAFKLLAKDLGVGMIEMIFIDDSEKSLSTAQECGFTPIRFEDYSQLRVQLKKLGILPTA